MKCSTVTEEVGGGGNRARRAAAVVGEDEDDDGDYGLPGSIPWSRTTRATRRSVCPTSIRSARSLAAAMRRRARARLRPWRLGLGFRESEEKGGSE